MDDDDNRKNEQLLELLSEISGSINHFFSVKTHFLLLFGDVFAINTLKANILICAPFEFSTAKPFV